MIHIVREIKNNKDYKKSIQTIVENMRKKNVREKERE